MKDANGNLKSEATAETSTRMDPLPSEWIPSLRKTSKPLVLLIKSRLVAGVTATSESVKKY